MQTSSRATRRLTFHTAADHHPRWSHDGRWIYFLSARADPRRPPKQGTKAETKQQVWRVQPNGSGLMAVTRKPRGVQAFDLGRALSVELDPVRYDHGGRGGHLGSLRGFDHGYCVNDLDRANSVEGLVESRDGHDRFVEGRDGHERFGI